MEAFSKVDDLVSKPVLGSDGARVWQDFAKKSAKKATTKQSSAAPQAPLKAQERQMGFKSWHDEKQAAASQEGGVVTAGYTHFKKKHPQHDKKSGTSNVGDEWDNDGYNEETGTFDTTATVNSAKPKNNDTNYVDDTTTTTILEKKKRRKKRKVMAPTIVHDPTHPLEQVAARLQQQQQQQQLQSNGGDSNLPPGWYAAPDPTTQQTYYYHAVAGERTWTKPTMDANHEKEKKKKNDIQDSWSEKNNNNNNDEESLPSASRSLPPGWSTATDPATQKMYYYHADQQITSWEKPTTTTE